jgi:hypothetical protein
VIRATRARPSKLRPPAPPPPDQPLSARPAPAPSGYDSSIRLDIFASLLSGMRPGRMIDLGTGHGAFARVGRDLGWEVTAVDARRDRMPMDFGITWVQADVRDHPIDGFDLISVLGLFYHLELADQLQLLQRCQRTPLVLDTHVAEHPAVTIDGYDGQYFREATSEVTASWINERSFWPTEPSLNRMLHHAGYRFVFKLEPAYYPYRGFYHCV